MRIGLHPRAADEPPIVDGQIQHGVAGAGQLLGVVGVGGARLLPQLEAAGMDIPGGEDPLRRLGQIDPRRPQGSEPEPPREEVPLARPVGRSDLDGAVHAAVVEIGGPVETRLPDVLIQVVEEPEAALALVGQQEAIVPFFVESFSQIRFVQAGEGDKKDAKSESCR